MLENLVKLKGVKVLDKQQQPNIVGGGYPGCSEFSGIAHCADAE
ncbi:hypothetical protein [Aquimarina pacifica]|nr:hypothetical protein [Aquimarina pacifica]